MGNRFLFGPILVFLLHYCYVKAAVLNINTDQASLLALKEQITYDPNNTLARNWLSGSHVCNWVGITCGSSHLRVTVLDLSLMGLVGTISPHVGNLTFLSQLILTNNSFHGFLPNELAQLRRLRFLSIRFNNVSGEIPSWFVMLPKLDRLYLGYNNFVGTIPPSLFNISSMQRLDLEGNNLRGFLPSNMFNLPALIYLSIYDNQISGSIPSTILNNSLLLGLDLRYNNLSGEVPENIFDHLPNLQELYLSRNNFSGKIPSAIFSCKQLQYLSMSYNSFTGTILAAIGNATMLTDIFLSYNNLQGTIPYEIGNLPNLQILGLQSCNLIGSIPPALFNTSTIVEIALTENQLSGTLPTNLGLTLPNLERLILPYNNLTGPFPTSSSNASKLTELDLIYNSFSGYIPNNLGNLRNLQWLNLAYNNLTFESAGSAEIFFASLGNCKYLQRVELSGNSLNVEIPISIGNLSSSVDQVGLEGCNLWGRISVNVGNLSGLTYINLAMNELTGTIPIGLSKLQNLQALYLSQNELQGFFPQQLCLLESLWSLGLQGNKFFGPLPSCLGNLTSLRQLFLASNQFNSTLPTTLWDLADILLLDLSLNYINGSLPSEIVNLKVITELYLTHNRLSGNIPSGIDSLQNAITLSLAKNEFEGSIPESFGRLIGLEYLDLSENNLSGVIPKSLEQLQHLKFFNVSFNKLQGEIPNGGPFSNFSAQSFVGNEQLCGDPRLQVIQCTIAASGKTRKAIVKYVVPPIVIVATIFVLALIFFVSIKRQKGSTQGSVIVIDPSPAAAATWRRISYRELEQATNGFNEMNLIGEGSFGKVYKGRLSDGMDVAVKVFDLQQEEAFKSFDSECKVLCCVRHRNLTKIITSCSMTDFKALVLSYMSNGSLEQWLHSGNQCLSLIQRLNIMLDVAAALDYLHHGCFLPIVHCDLKPSNVLLDENMVAHVTDFGITKLLSKGDSITQTMTLATMGYMAPEYGLEGLVSKQGDVYSYGILLMEIFTGKKPTDEMFLGEFNIWNWVKESMISGAVNDVIDEKLLTAEKGQLAIKQDCFLSVMELALNCSAESPQERTNMKEVLAELEKIKICFLK